ncbi:MAG TPA: YfiR family protein [Bryobacteraceae bacterium]|jgi:hypothetical protein|nr:YfiR family protein [Bryobacteraceae bacterium]
MTRVRQNRWRAIVFVLLPALAIAARAAQPEATVAGIEAAFLYNFSKFIEWPDGTPTTASDSFLMCVTGDSSVQQSLEEIAATRTINGRRITLKHLKIADSARSCQILFVGPKERASLTRILQDLQGASVLTVGISEDFAKDGGMIGFVLDADRVRFVVNAGAAGKARLKVSSKLLSLAIAVEK